MPPSPSASFKPWHAIAAAATGSAATCLLFAAVGAPRANALNLLCALISVPTAAALLFKLARERRYSHQVSLEPAKKAAQPHGKAEALLDKTGRIAGIGGWEVDLLTGEVTWS